MNTFDQLPAEEQQAIRDEMERRYFALDGEDIDLAIKRYRRILAEHDRELEHVSQMDFEKPYRWRVAPGIALRAEKALELQKKRRRELYSDIFEQVMGERAGTDLPSSSASPTAEAPTAEQVEVLTSQFAEAMKELEQWKLEGQEASPPATSAA